MSHLRTLLHAGDVIVALGGRQVHSVEDSLAALRQHKPGDRVAVTVLRNAKKKTIDVTLSGRALG
jgi:putative serine protease PepD